MNQLDFIVFDLETGGLQSDFHEAIQVAGKAYDARTLEPYPIEAGGEFCSLMKPLYPERLQDGALKVNGKTREELAKAPDQKVVWNAFVAWVNKFNKKRNTFGAPIACGKNIRNFDLKFVDVLNALHCPKKEKTLLFSTRLQVELEDQILQWFSGDPELPNMKMDTLREYFGLSTESAHDALEDTRQTGALIFRFMKLHRELRSRKNREGEPLLKFRGSMAGVC